MRKFYVLFAISVLLSLLIFSAGSLIAFDDGITGLTKKNGVMEGCSCHSISPFNNVNVSIICPDIIAPNDTILCKLRISGGPLIAGGCDIAVGTGYIFTTQSDTSLKRVLVSLNNYELTHKYPKIPTGDTVIWYFKYIAPNTPGAVDTIFANGNSVNLNGLPEGDQWNFAVNKLITISNPVHIVGTEITVNKYFLNQNYPNPYNPLTIIRYGLPNNNFVKLEVFDLLGRKLETLVNETKTKGVHNVAFDASRYSSGIYFYKIEAGDYSKVMKMVLIK